MKPFEEPLFVSEVKEPLKQAIAVCDRWAECCQNMWRVWRSSTTHRWDGEPYTPTAIIKYGQRLNEVLQIRSAREQYAVLVKTVRDEQNSAAADDTTKSAGSYSHFDGIEPLQYNPYTESKWQEAVAAYDRSMSYMDQKTAQILKMHLRQAQSNPRQVRLIFANCFNFTGDN
jgi:dynein heavy chain 2